jgi:hypothetical protein
MLGFSKLGIFWLIDACPEFDPAGLLELYRVAADRRENIFSIFLLRNN